MADSSSTSSKPVQRDSQPAPGDARTEEVSAGPERVPKDAMSPPAPAPTALHQRLQRSMGPSLGSSPMHSPRSALRALDPESQTRLGHHTPTSSPGAGSSALPIHLEGRSYRFQHSHNTDSPGATKAQLSTSPPVESDGVQYSSSYTATSNAIRDNTAMLANMALYDDDHSPDREEGGEEEEQDRTHVQSARVQWRDSSSSSSELGSGFQFQPAQSGDRGPDQDLLSTSPRAQPNRGPGMLTLALGVMDDENQPPAIVTSPPPIEYSGATPRLAGAVSQSTFSEFGQRCESNAGTTDTGSDFSVRAPAAPVVPASATAAGGTPEENAEARRASVPTRHIAAAQHGEQQGPARAIHMQRRTSAGAATPQDLFIARATSMSPAGTGVNAFKPSSFSGFAAFGASHRGSFGFGALAQAQAQAEAQTQQAHHTGGSGAGGGGGGGSGDRTSGTSAIQLPGGFSFANARTSGVGGRRSSIARPSNPPGASSFSIHRTSSMGRRSLPHGGGGTNDSNYGSVVSSDVREDNFERGRYGGRRDTHDSDDTDERQALLSADRSWRNVLGGRRQDSSPRPAPTRAATIYNAVTYPVRAVSSLLFSPRSRSRSPARSSSSGTPAVGARERIMKKMTKENLKAMVTEPITVLPAVVLGLLLNLLDGVSYGMITFPNSNPIFAHFGGDGVAMFFVTCIISQLIYSLGGSVFKAGNGSMMIEVVPFYHILVRKIVEEIGDNNPAAVIATTCMAFALSSVLTGLVFLLLGLLRLGVLIGFFPRHILVGCIGGVGIFLLETGFEVAGRLQSEDGFQYNLETLKFFFQSPHEVALWSIPLGLAILLRVITARFNHPLVVPAYFVIMPAVFFAVTLPFGFSLARLQGSGWVFDIGSAADAPFWRFYTYFDLTQTSWMALVATMPTQFALVFLSVLHPPLNIPALAVSVGQDDVNTDRELTAHGWSNIIAGAHVLIPALGFLIAGKHLQA